MHHKRTALLSDFCILFKKDLLLLAKGKNYLWALFFLSLLLVTTTSASLSLAWLEPTVTERLFAPLLWLIFLLTCVVTLEKGYEHDAQGGACYGLLLTGVSPSVMYLAKVASLTVTIVCSHVVTMFLLALLLAVPLSGGALPLVLLSLPVVLGFSAIATIVQPMSMSSPLGGLLLPVVLLPLLFPLFFAASSLSSTILLGDGAIFGSFSLTLLLVLDVLYLCVGINVYESVLRG